MEDTHVRAEVTAGDGAGAGTLPVAPDTVIECPHCRTPTRRNRHGLISRRTIQCHHCGRLIVLLSPIRAALERINDERASFRAPPTSPETVGGEPDHEPDTLCPVCNSPMVRKKGPRGFFLGCTGFPACRGNRNLPLHMEPEPAVSRRNPRRKSEPQPPPPAGPSPSSRARRRPPPPSSS